MRKSHAGKKKKKKNSVTKFSKGILKLYHAYTKTAADNMLLF
jgi:hypothetical protein